MVGRPFLERCWRSCLINSSGDIVIKENMIFLSLLLPQIQVPKVIFGLSLSNKVLAPSVPPNKALVWTAQAALFCWRCLIEVGLAGQIGVKSGCACWRRGVLYSPLLLIGGVFVPPTA